LTLKNTLLIAAVILFLTVFISGCDSERDKREREEHQRQFEQTIKSTKEELQWKLDDETATHLFGVNEYLTFRKCHEERLTGGICKKLQQRVADAEAKFEKEQHKSDDKFRKENR